MDMFVLRSACRSALCVLLGCAGWALEVGAHGNVVAEEDACVLKIGFYTAHFAAFQPRTRQHFEFCEDLPDVTETVFVLDYMHDSMRTVPVDFRIVRDSSNLGRFARSEDVMRLDLERDTVFYQPPIKQIDAVFTVLHSFAEPGDYIGVVTAKNPAQNDIFTAVFPFSVGTLPWTTYALGALVVVLTLTFVVWLRFTKRHKTYVELTVLSICLCMPLMWNEARAEVLMDQVHQLKSHNGRFLVSFETSVHPIPINSMHTWILRVEDDSNHAVPNASIVVTGGMPAHDHGLSTAPRVTRYLGDGRYLVEGMKFHMPGHWQIEISVDTETASDSVVIDIDL